MNGTASGGSINKRAAATINEDKDEKSDEGEGDLDLVSY
jgi:hypothetical protein